MVNSPSSAPSPPASSPVCRDFFIGLKGFKPLCYWIKRPTTQKVFRFSFGLLQKKKAKGGLKPLIYVYSQAKNLHINVDYIKIICYSNHHKNASCPTRTQCIPFYSSLPSMSPFWVVFCLPSSRFVPSALLGMVFLVFKLL